MPNLPPQLEIKPLTKPFAVTIDDLPGSKSLTNRALLLAALAQGKSTLTNVLFSDDTRVMMTALKKLGFNLKDNESNRTVTVEGSGGTIPHKKADLHLGNAGTAMRFLTAACCLGEPGSQYTLDGIPRMRERPIGELVEPLRQLGATIKYLGEEGYPPLRVHGGIRGGEVTMNPSISSQFVSALMLMAPFCDKSGLTIQFTSKPVSYPYIEMTFTLLESFGYDNHIHTEENLNDKNTVDAIQVGAGALKSRSGNIEPDASNASYFLSAAAMVAGSTIRIKGLPGMYLQGDTDYAKKCLRAMGAKVDYDNDAGITVTAPQQLIGIGIDLNDMPDMAQTLAVVALFAEGPTTIRNVGNLRVKETDRMAALENELTKLGATVTIDGDDITITPPVDGKLKPATIKTYDDHRMAMSFAIVGLRSPGIVIDDPACVNKTFPEFFDYLERLRS